MMESEEKFYLYVLIKEPNTIIRISDKDSLQSMTDDLAEGKGSSLVKITQLDQLKDYSYNKDDIDQFFEVLHKEIKNIPSNLEKLGDFAKQSASSILDLTKDAGSKTTNAIGDLFSNLGSLIKNATKGDK